MTTEPKPRLTLTGTAAAGLCHFCLHPPLYTILGEDELRQRRLILRVCRAHLAFVQGSLRSPIRLLEIQDSGEVDLSTAQHYVVRRYEPDVQRAPLLLK